MSTNEKLTGSKQYPQINLIAPMEVLDIKVEDPQDPTKFSEYHILDEENNRIDAHTIRSICEVTNKEWRPLKGGTHFVFPIEMFDLFNHTSEIKALLQAHGFNLGGEDFNNPDLKAFWLLEYKLLMSFLETSNLNKEIT